MNVILNLLIKDPANSADCCSALSQFLEMQGYKLVSQTLPDTVLISGVLEQAEETAQDVPPDVPAEVAPVELPAVELPAAEPATTEPATPELRLSFEQAVIVNLDAGVSVPVSFDPTRHHSVLQIASALTEDVEAHNLKFKYAQREYSVPIFDGTSDLVENVGDAPEGNTFRALIKAEPDPNKLFLRAVRLRIEVAEGAEEKLIFGQDLTALITSHEEPSDALIS
jgi:hypothetical protein